MSKRIRIISTHSCRILLFQNFENISSRKALYHFILIFSHGRAKTSIKNFLHHTAPLKFLIIFLQLRLFFRCKPIPDSFQKFMFQLGIDLFMLDMRAIYLPFHFHTKKTAAPCRVGKQIKTIARTDKRSNTWQVAIVPLIGFAKIQVRHLHQILQ